ncbi:MAG TPA: thioredoxin family protein [Cryomorphaceae bacterium]|nr:thioredoxin family protein [Cryomorphaceae bacterium]|tara:strand:- start:75 stop:677 length:603 start_codon:yes stop_codon:yes gene_type:complete
MEAIQLTQALRAAMANGQTYEEYSAMNKAMAKKGTTTGPQKPSYIEYTKLSAARISRWEKTYKPAQSTLENITSRTTPSEHWLVFSETWCGDAAHNLPFIARLAKHAGVNFRIILRDENKLLMDEFLTNGGRSIPKLVRLNDKFEVLITWGPRPTPLMEQYTRWKSQPEFDNKEWTLFAQNWYNKDQGASLEADFIELLG